MTDLLSIENFFTERGIVKKTITIMGTEIEIEINRLTNRESDELAAEFTEIVGDGAEINTAGLIEERIMKCLIDMNFDFNGKKWSTLPDPEKRRYLGMMNPKLREALSIEIMGESYIQEEEKDFLLKLS